MEKFAQQSPCWFRQYGLQHSPGDSDELPVHVAGDEGVEYLVFTAAWEAAQGAGAPPPQVLGQPLPASSHAFPGGTGSIAHYELHAWIWSPNPLGMFYPYNPDISC